MRSCSIYLCLIRGLVVNAARVGGLSGGSES